MPELPEVEVTRIGLAAQLVGSRVRSAVARVPAGFGRGLAGQHLAGIRRRGKYLLFDFDDGHLLVHLGMSGSLRLVAPGKPPRKHDHVDIDFDGKVLRFRDPRRFGACLWIAGDPADHPLLARLGMEPLAREFTAAALAAALDGRQSAIKPAIMDANIVVGVGNIYASESLHRAGIDPRTPAGRISRSRLARLVPAIKATLRAAIRAGGSSLRDYVRSDGGPGDFQLRHRVYGRAGESCRVCGAPIRMLRQSNRATYYCPRCQR